MKSISALVSLYAVVLLMAGVGLLFAPEAFSPIAEGTASQPLVLAQLIGAALLGFGTASWTARKTILGGIYGRAVVVGNQMFAFVGALVLLKSVPATPTPAFWGLLLVLALGAALYSVLLFRSPKMPRGSKTD